MFTTGLSALKRGHSLFFSLSLTHPRDQRTFKDFFFSFMSVLEFSPSLTFLSVAFTLSVRKIVEGNYLTKTIHDYMIHDYMISHILHICQTYSLSCRGMM